MYTMYLFFKKLATNIRHKKIDSAEENGKCNVSWEGKKRQNPKSLMPDISNIVENLQKVVIEWIEGRRKIDMHMLQLTWIILFNDGNDIK